MRSILSVGVFTVLLLVGLAAQDQRPVPPLASTGYSITGTVVNALTGEILPRTQVMIAASERNGVARSMITANDGRFEFHGLAPAKYALMAQRKGFFRQAFNEHANFSTAIAVGPNLQSEGLVFRLRPEALISGTITDEAGDPVTEAQVFLFYRGIETGLEETSQHGQTISDDQGRYHFNHLFPGRYFLVVTARPWYAQTMFHRRVVVHAVGDGSSNASAEPQSDTTTFDHGPLDVTYPVTYYASGTDSSQATPIVVNAGDHFTADVALTPMPAYHVRIKNPNPRIERGGQFFRPGIGVQVFHNAFGRQLSVGVQSQSNEEYTEILGLASGPAVLAIEEFGDGATHNPTSRVIALDVANDSAIDLLQKSSALVVDGQVTLEGGGALPSRMFITFRNLGSGEEFSSAVSPEGKFELETPPLLLPGRYVISTFNNGEVFLRNVTATRAAVSGRVLELPGAGAVHLHVSVSRGLGQVKGTAMRDSKPEAGVMVVLVPQHPGDNPTLFRRDQSDSDGTFTLAGVVPGSYTLIAIENGWDLEWRSPAVLNSYLKKGQKVEVQVGGKYHLPVEVQ